MPNPIPVDDRLAWIEEQESWRLSLPDPPVPDFLTGTKLRAPDPRDYLMPGAEALGLVGLPDSADITSDFPGPVLNQGGTPSCVCHTISHQMAIFQYQEERLARVFHASRAHLETGPEGQGRWPDDILKYARDRGMPLTGSEQRFRIVSYAFAPKTSQQAWVESIKAAIVNRQPVPICYLLPAVFGWESSGVVTSGYHETLIVGYRPGAFLMLNSWGTGWGKNGFGWVPIEFLLASNWQNGYVIAHSSVKDETTAPPIPPDPPDPIDPPTPPTTRVFLAGEALGGGLEMLQEGQVLAATGHGFTGTITVNEVRRQTDPTPPPNTFTVTGYDRNPVKAGESFLILGNGFMSGNLLVSWGGQALAAFVSSPTRIDATAPNVSATATNPVQVRIEGAVSTGPPLVVRVEDTPLPPGEIIVTIQPPMGGRLFATATLDGAPIATQMTMFANGENKGTRNVPAGNRGNWPVPGPSGTVVRVEARNPVTGKTGQAERTI